MDDIDLRMYILKRENPVIFDTQSKFIYFPVNKVMQTTLVRNLLKKRCIVYKDNKVLWKEVFDKTDFNKVYKFGITRDPIKKFESAFNYLKKHRISKRMKINDININDYIKNKVAHCDNPFKLNPHFEKQYESFFYNGKLIVDELFKIEDKEQICKMCQKLDIEYTKVKYNVTKHKEIINEESIKILKKIYFNDIKYLHY
jgi:hypothetical protein